jgi:uncharacterized protein with PhoU and TrkA domain
VNLETIDYGGKVYAYVIRGGPPAEGTRYLTPGDCNLQVGYVVYPGGSEILRHIHLPLERHIVGTTEVLIVQRGRCEVDIYDDERQIIVTRALGAGDVLIAVGGGHGFRVLEDTVLLEVKQGPYPGGAEKERF